MNKTIDENIVIQTLTEKIDYLESTMYEMRSQTKRALLAARCLVSALNDNDVLLAANWILDHMQNGFYYDQHKIILAANDRYDLGTVNAAMSILESSGIIGRKTVRNTDTVYLAEMQHAWIVSEVEEESNVS